MITVEVQTEVIEELQNHIDLVAELGTSSQIKEDSWPGPDWVYPAVRVGMDSLTPISTGNCHTSEWAITFSVFVFTQPTVSGAVYNTSSQQCNNIVREVKCALLGTRIESAGNFVPITAINIAGENEPVPEPPPGGWRGEVLFEVKVREV